MVQLLPPAVAALYAALLADGETGVARFYTALRARGIDPTPNPAADSPNLYNPMPVIVSAALVEQMVADANRFCAVLRDEVRDATALLARMPSDVRAEFASPDVAARIITDLRTAHPLAGIDAFLEATPQGLVPAYLEWQTVGMYLTLGLTVMACMATAWPALRQRSTLTARPDLTLDALAARLRSLYLAGIEDDPRQGVVLDYRPQQQPTRAEFRAIQALTGGADQGMAILDPRDITFHDGRPHYRRAGTLIRVRRIYARLVYSDMQRLRGETTSSERRALRRLFGEGAAVTWITHPLHFFYGSKADFPRFWHLGLSPALNECWWVDEEFISQRAPSLATDNRLLGYVQKPTTSQSGHGVVQHPHLNELRAGAILQREIRPASWHPTLWGVRSPEIRVMCLPETGGRLSAGLVYTRVKAPGVFLSNAGAIAGLGAPGTGEGYGVVVV